MFRKDPPQVDVEIFTVFDSKTQSYEMPSFAINHLDLQRQIINMFKQPDQANNKFLVNAEDFSIFRIGTYDKKTGMITTTNLTHIANFHDLRAIAAPEQRVNRTPLTTVAQHDREPIL